jgi:hypothetical protein
MNSPNQPEIPRAACREFDLALESYLEGEPRPFVEQHARACEFCSAVLADLETLRGQCRALPEEQPPAILWTNVRGSLEAEGILKESRAACREFDLGLSAYLEGEPRPEVERHARECAFCSVVLADLEALRAECRALPAEDPPALVWSNVRSALEAEGVLKEPSTGFWRLPRLTLAHWAAPAGVLAALAVAAGLLVTTPLHKVDVAPVTTTAAVVDPVSTDLVKAVSQLEENYAARESSLDPNLQATYRKSLDSLDASIKECRETIHTKPSDALAQEYLLAAYTEKAEVLESALEMDAR